MVAAQYKKLFFLKVYHAYFLNSGMVSFDDLDENDKRTNLRKYNWQDFLKITPTQATLKNFKKYQLLFRNTSEGIIIFSRVMEENVQESFISLDQDLVLSFLIAYKDPYFENYTAIGPLSNEKILLSNFLPVHFQEESFDLMPIESDNAIFSDSFVVSRESIDSYFADGLNPGESNLAKGLLLFRMQGENGNLNITNVNGTLKINPTVFKVNFDNRSTFWTYHQQAINTSVTTNSPKPLTKNGFVQIHPDSDFDEPNDDLSELQFPNPSVERIKIEENNYYSEIYI
ncbi:hypothetical protein [Cyclobacterium marinum]|uniref:Uncharacterized protein n=1 Tax=Cyclobacterium marinum (strain ATCC 25205 / DSM 745 / LMG 13164 / NCIMB 1802) TaxID=880070 RepID=G0J5K6_CYCMS|nr:hypothetical protein [Cyclobacterium marinum]AEL28455.1 hypothetical protein Cycma_4770 [Cyclobacterium marinum DSM 745]